MGSDNRTDAMCHKSNQLEASFRYDTLKRLVWDQCPEAHDFIILPKNSAHRFYIFALHVQDMIRKLHLMVSNDGSEESEERIPLGDWENPADLILLQAALSALEDMEHCWESTMEKLKKTIERRAEWQARDMNRIFHDAVDAGFGCEPHFPFEITGESPVSEKLVGMVRESITSHLPAANETEVKQGNAAPLRSAVDTRALMQEVFERVHANATAGGDHLSGEENDRRKGSPVQINQELREDCEHAC